MEPRLVAAEIAGAVAHVEENAGVFTFERVPAGALEHFANAVLRGARTVPASTRKVAASAGKKASAKAGKKSAPKPKASKR